jgi:hypothetical protein
VNHYMAMADRWFERGSRLWLRMSIILGALGATAFLAPRASTTHLTMLLAGVVGVILLRWPPLGLIALVIFSAALPFSLGTGTGTSLNASTLLLPVLAGIWALRVLGSYDLPRLSSRPYLPLFALVLVAGIAFLNGGRSLMSFAQPAPIMAQVGGLAVFVLSAVGFLLAGHQLRDSRWLRAVTWLFLALGALYVVGRVFPQTPQFTAGWFVRGASSLFWVWLLAIAFSQAAFNRHLHFVWRLALACLSAAIVYIGLFHTLDWTSGWLPPLVALGVTLWVGSPRVGRLVLLAGVTAVLVNLSMALSAVMVGDNEYSLVTRVEAWLIMGEIVKVSPLLGLGPANYYWYTPLFPILGWTVQFNSHNNFVDIIAQIGLLGLGCFLWFSVEVTRVGLWLRKRVQPGFEQAYVYGALGGVAGMMAAAMLGDWVLPFVYNVGLDGFRISVLGWVFLGGLVALEQSIKDREAGEQRDARGSHGEP